MNSLFIIDYQNDFVSGVFAAHGAAGLDGKISEYVKKFDGRVFYTVDCHGDEYEYKNSREGRSFPVQCKSGSWGADVYGQTKNALAEVCAYEIRKTAFAFDFNSEICSALENYTDTIEIAGLLTDMCVLSCAVVIASKYHSSEIVINSSLCMGSSTASHKNALEIMKGLNMKII